MLRPVTRALIEAAHRYSGIYRDFNANHLPMGLTALDAMGASDEQLALFARANEAKLEPMAAPEAERVAYFERWIGEDGYPAVIRAMSGELAPAVCTAAFHGAIRAAYALESGIVGEQAHALAYWTGAMETLPEVPAPQGRDAPFEVLRAIANDPAFAGKRPTGRSIAGRMQGTSGHPAFAGHVARLDPAALHVDHIAPALIRAYAATGDFTLLHGVTGSHAFRLLAPHFADPALATRHFWTAVVAAYMSAGSPPIEAPKLRGNETLEWPEIHARAGECEDEHDVKFAYSCWREWEHRRGAPPTGTGLDIDLYKRAASARVSLATEPASAG